MLKRKGAFNIKDTSINIEKEKCATVLFLFK
jgi:hypothetical protein